MPARQRIQAAALQLGLVACVSFAPPVWADPAGPGDFGQNSELIDFNNLPPGVELSLQLTALGITASADSDAAIVAVDQNDTGFELASPPVALRPDIHYAVIDFDFSTPRNAVGLYFLLPQGEALLMLAYDQQGNFLEQVQVASDTVLNDTRANDPADFIGLVTDGSPSVSKIRLVAVNQGAAPVLDDLLVEPSAADAVDIGPYLNDLAPGAPVADKLAAINDLLLLPSPQTSTALLDVGKNDPESEVRESALLALSQHYDINALPGLVDIGLNDPDAQVGSAARNAVHVLRELWPIPDPPVIEFTATGPFQPGQPFTTTATVLSPVDRDRVLLRHNYRNGLMPVVGENWAVIETSLQAGVPLVWNVEMIAEAAGRAELELIVDMNLDLVDQESYSRSLYFEIDTGGGSVSTELFPDAPPAGVKILSGGGQN